MRKNITGFPVLSPAEECDELIMIYLPLCLGKEVFYVQSCER